MLPFKILLTAMSLIALTNCNLPDTQKRQDAANSASSFFVEKLSGNFTSEKFHDDISIPKERVYTFKACLKDLKKSKAITNHPFLIEEINQEVKSDSSGCVNWTEGFSLEYLTEPSFLKMERKIVSKGLHTGAETIIFAINPWDIETYKEIVDLSKNNISPLTEGEAATLKLKGTDEKIKSDLWLEDGRLFVTDDKLGENFQLKYDFSLQPLIKLKKTSGEATNYNLKYGLFKGKVEIIQRYFDGKTQENAYDILSSAEFNNAKMEKGILAFSKILVFSAPPARGNIFIRISLSTVKKIANLNSFSGIFPLGEYRNLRNNQFLKVSNSPDLIKEVTEKLPTSNSDNKAKKDFVDNSNDTKADSMISILPLTFRVISGKQLNYHKKVISYNVTACFTNNLVSTPLAFQKFKVHGFSQNDTTPGDLKEPKKAQQNGCIFWTDTIEFDMYDCHQFFRGYVIIENENFSFKEKRHYFINPWEPYEIAYDEANIENVNVFKTSCMTKNPKKSEIVLDGVAFENRGQKNDDRINSKLEMEIKRFFGITIHPKVSIPSDLRHDYNAYTENLANGIYLLRVVIFRNFETSNKTELISQKDIPVLNKNNVIYGNFDFYVKDKRLLEAKNTILLQLLPVKQDQFVSVNDYTIKQKDESMNIEETIDKDTKLLSPIYMQEIALDGDARYGNLRTFSGSEIISHLGVDYKDENKTFNLSKFINEFKLKRDQEQRTLEANIVSPEALAAKNSLTFMPSPSQQNFPFLNAIYKSIENKKVSFDVTSSQQLCDYWFKNLWKDKFNLGERILKAACNKAAKNNLRSFFDFDHVFIVKNIKSSQYIGPGAEKTITTTSNFSLSTSLSKYTTTQSSLAGKVGVSPFKNSFASVGAEFAVSISSGSQSAQGEANTISLSESTSLQVTESQFKISTDNYQYCLAVKPNPSLFYNSGKNIFQKFWDGDFDYSYFFKSGLAEDEKLRIANAGILICQKPEQSKPISFVEQYYWIQPTLSTNEMQDSKDERTRIFSIMLRGNQDYSRLKFFLTNNWANPAGTSLGKSEGDKVFNNILLLNSFKETSPGVYIFKDQNK